MRAWSSLSPYRFVFLLSVPPSMPRPCRRRCKATQALSSRRAAVVDARRVARGYGSFLVEGRLQPGESFRACLLVDELVGRERDRITFFLREHDRHDLFLEPPGVLRCRGLLLRGQRKGVLLAAIDAVLLGHVFRSDAHVVLVVDVP